MRRIVVPARVNAVPRCSGWLRVALTVKVSIDVSARSHTEDSAAVLRPALFGRLRADPALRPKAHDRYPLGRDATRDQVIAGRARPTLAEGDVVLGGAALVAVPLDQHGRRRVRLEPLGVRREHLRVVGPDVV